jgi:hypothetical protein
MCSESIKFEPIELFKGALMLVRPDLVNFATIDVPKDLLRYLEGDSKKLRGCLVSMIGGYCSVDIDIKSLRLAIHFAKTPQNVPSRHRLWIRFEVHAQNKAEPNSDL